MSGYRVFTIESGRVTEGAQVSKFHLQGPGIDIPAITVGEEGCGRELGVLPVQLTEGQKEWEEKGQVRVEFAEVGQTKAGKPKLFARSMAASDEKILVVFLTRMGYRGGNDHSGDRIGWKCGSYSCGVVGTELVAPEVCPKCGSDRTEHIFAGFPGEILVKGIIAEGAAGRMGSGEQLVAAMPKGIVFRTGYSGRLYGGPSAHYYVWTGEKLLSATWDERTAADLF